MESNSQQLPYSYYGAKPSRWGIPASQLNILKEKYGITGEDCFAFCFDGRAFVLINPVTWMPKSIPYKQMKFIEMVDSLDLHLGDSRLDIPNEILTSYYRQTRLDGGPDRMYKDNLGFTVCRCTVHFHSHESFSQIHIYSRDSNQVTIGTQRFNRLIQDKDAEN